MSFFNDFIPDPNDYDLVDEVEVDPDRPFAEWTVSLSEARRAVVL